MLGSEIAGLLSSGLKPGEVRTLIGEGLRLDEYLAGKSSVRLVKYRGALGSSNARVIGMTDADYPEYLRSLSSPPVVIFVRGELSALRQGIGFVGTRASTAIATGVARATAQACKELGVPLHSGGAKGTDSEGHLQAVEQGVRTVAWMPCGLSAMNGEQDALAQKILNGGGCIVSELLPKTGSSPGTLMARNRLIVAGSKALVVGEGNLYSRGTMGSVRLALGAHVPLLVPVLRGKWSEAKGGELARALVEPISGETLGVTQKLSKELGLPLPVAVAVHDTAEIVEFVNGR